MSGAVLLISFIVIRFGVLALFGASPVRRAAFFAPLLKSERIPYLFYQFSNIGIFVCILFLKVRPETRFFGVGAAVYILGNAVLLWSIICFAKPSESGFNKNGIYRYSRNPMYTAYFLFFIGCVMLTGSPILLGLTAVFILSTHTIVLSEERWCAERFGEEYDVYLKSVRRYI